MLQLNGLFLTTSSRIPAPVLGATTNFTLATSVATWFGASATEAVWAGVYFNGYDNSTQKPGMVKFTRFPATAIAAYLQSGAVSGYTLAQLQALSGSLTVNMDGTPRVAASINLSGAASFSAAATLIQTGLNGSPSTLATVTGSIAAGTAISVTGSIAANVLTVTAVSAGTIVPGAILTGTGVAAGTRVTSQLSGTTGGVGTYAVVSTAGLPQTVASTTISGTYGVLTVTAVSSGTLAVGQTIAGGTTQAGTFITGLGTGTGLTGTYYVSPSQTVTSTTITATPTPVVVTYDSVSGSFLITSGIVGAASTAAYATGTLAASLFLTSATGAVLSQGWDAQTPASFMNAVIANDRNWATFTTILDPDNGPGNGNVQKLAFASWNNGQNNTYCYVAWDSDASPTASSNASTSFGQQVIAANYSGTAPIYDSLAVGFAPFTMGSIASIDFTRLNGRITLAFRSQTGLTADVTSATVASNLTSNGYNYYGAYATAAQTWQFEYTGLVSGPFKWLDSYVDEIWLNAALQQALMNLLVNTPSIPYNQDGYTMIKAAMLDPVNNAVNFGAIRTGITLSQQQIAQMKNAAGLDISQSIVNQGYYIQVKDPGAQVRALRGSPVCTLFYSDGQSVQKISLASIEIM